MADPRVEVVGLLSEDEVRAVADLVEAATEVDGVRPLSEHVMLHLRYGGDAPVRNVLIYGSEGSSIGSDEHDTDGGQRRTPPCSSPRLGAPARQDNHRRDP